MLISCRLSPAERAIHIAARKEIYERINGRAKAVGGNARAIKAGQKEATANLAVAFTSDTAAKTGRPERGIRRDAQRANSIPNIADVVGTSLDKGKELDERARIETCAVIRYLNRARPRRRVDGFSLD